MSSQTPFYSQGFNFESFVQKGVDPRTGQYACSVNIYKAPAQTRNCPEFKLTLNYHALNPQDTGLGTGWSFNLSSYEHRQRKTLILLTGENYQVTETASLFLVKEQKLKSFQARKIKLGYEVVYNKIQDGGDVLLEVRYEASQVRITQNPGTPEASTLTLVQRNNQLKEIQLPVSKMPPWEFSYMLLVAVDAFSGLVSGALGAVSAGVVSGAFKTTIQTQLGRVASYALVKESFKTVLKGVIKDAVIGVIIAEAAGHVIPYEKALYPSSGVNESQSQNEQLPDQSFGARDLSRPALGQGEAASTNMPGSSYGVNSGAGVGQSIPDMLNWELTCTFGPVGLPQSRPQSMGSGALEAVEKR
ncbi:wall-associated protein [Aspergillus udagawae]|uniref:Wall-associated protein n=1 Tax=Aspergillus udagawae TaxID=91492 RepID=A0ABQ1BB77_9EURO|nr:wall-associated protein [Aspergillus udagawae]